MWHLLLLKMKNTAYVIKKYLMDESEEVMLIQSDLNLSMHLVTLESTVVLLLNQDPTVI